MWRIAHGIQPVSYTHLDVYKRQLLAIMRLSPNPVFRAIAWVYLWIFRGTPVYVQLVFWGLMPVVYKSITLGIPFTEVGVEFATKDIFNYFTLAVIGLALNEACLLYTSRCV